MNLPADFVERMRALLGNESNDFFESLLQEIPVSIRKNNKLAFDKNLDPVLWCDNGQYLTERPLFTADPLFHAGAYYVQEASSMFLEQAVRQHVSGEVAALDLCAAPGGKSTHLANLLSEDSLLVSNEIIRSRAFILAENLTKWGNPNVVVTHNAPEDFAQLTAFFDLLLVDAPCSGEGMFRKDPEAIGEWSVEAVRHCARRQRKILAEAWDALKTDGILIYSTCTYNREENEENVRWILDELGAEFLPVETLAEWGISASGLGYRFYPHRTRGEGFFMAVLRKTSETAKPLRIKILKKNPARVPDGAIQLKNCLKNPDRWTIRLAGNRAKALSLSWETEMELLQSQFNVLSSGIALAEQKGKDFVPVAALALSKALNVSSTLSTEVNWQTAIAFLQKEMVVLPGDLPKGYVLLTYRNVPLGWVKNLGNRSNNLYPSEWRIRMNIVKNNIVRFDIIGE